MRRHSGGFFRAALSCCHASTGDAAQPATRTGVKSDVILWAHLRERGALKVATRGV